VRLLVHPTARSAAEGGLLLFFYFIFNDLYQTNYLTIYETDLHRICRDDRTMAVD